MYKTERTKNDMVNAVIELIEETGSSNISISQIAKKANTAVGLINYHYKSKQDLLVDAVRRYIENSIKEENQNFLKKNVESKEMIVLSFQSYADFLAKHGEISKLYIKFCLEGYIKADSLKQAIEFYPPILKSINSNLSDDKIMIILNMISSTIQLSFLEADIIKENTSFNFFEKKQRNKMIADMINLIQI